MPTVNGTPYVRTREGSSVLYDKVNGSFRVQELSDKQVQPSRYN